MDRDLYDGQIVMMKNILIEMSYSTSLRTLLASFLCRNEFCRPIIPWDRDDCDLDIKGRKDCAFRLKYTYHHSIECSIVYKVSIETINCIGISITLMLFSNFFEPKKNVLIFTSSQQAIIYYTLLDVET